MFCSKTHDLLQVYLDSQLTMLPMIPGNAAAAFSANFPSNLASAFNLSFIHFFTPCSSLGGGLPPLPDEPPVKAFTILSIIKPRAVTKAAIPPRTIPCSLKMVRIFSANDVSESKNSFDRLLNTSYVGLQVFSVLRYKLESSFTFFFQVRQTLSYLS